MAWIKRGNVWNEEKISSGLTLRQGVDVKRGGTWRVLSADRFGPAGNITRWVKDSTGQWEPDQGDDV